ncbi:MAG: hypothetical protein KDD66_12200 [Bdellovibrionales bacterium]|nr:hypothetical protein [Bdellovibrionales bacterium]
MLFVVTIVVAFCSMTYELLLGQALSAFLGNTLLRYSATIGLYMFSLGFGAYLVEKRWEKSPLSSLLIVELALAVLGGMCIAALHLLNLIGNPLLFSLAAHGLIVLIGTLSGFELPLLIAIGVQLREMDASYAERIVLSASYIGAFIATIVFAFWFYPLAGVTSTAFGTASINAMAGMYLGVLFYRSSVGSRKYLALHFCLLMVFVAAWVNGKAINDIFVSEYLSAGTANQASHH